MIVWAAIGVIVVAFFLSAMGTSVTRTLAVRFNMLDIPSGHKAHAKPTPLLGGCAIFIAILITITGVLAAVRIWAVTGIPSWLPGDLAIHIQGAARKAPMALGILACAAILHVLGLMDDRKHIGAWLKLAVQTIVCVAAVGLLNIRALSMLGEPYSFILTVVWLIVITNAFNFLDNMDGLSVGVAIICAVAMLGACAGMGQVFVAAWLCVIIGALAGFLPYNFPPASTFMGDAGALVIGFMLGVISCLTTYVKPEAGRNLYSVFVPLVSMAIPLYDMVSVILLRIRMHSNPMIGDNRHFSHRLVKRGMSVRKSLLTIYLCTAGTAIAASLLPHVRSNTGAILVLAQTIIILLIVAMLESGQRSGN